MTRCLLVDDDTEIRDLVADHLPRYGLAVTAVPDGAAMRRALAARPASDPFAVLLLDLMLPGDDGLALCREVRAASNLPILMLTARGDPDSRVQGLETGADDYLPKPFEPRELVARVHALLRRAQHGAATGGRARAAATVRFDGWTFDRPGRRLLSPEGVMVLLSLAESRLLQAFLEHPGRVLGRQVLLDLVHTPGVDVTDRSIDLAVSRLRQKLRDPSREPRLIRTVRGEGYLCNTRVAP